MWFRKCAFSVFLGVVVLASGGFPESRADLIADPDELTGYPHGARIDDAFPGITLSAGARNWDSLGSWVRYCTGHVVNYQYAAGNYTIGWEVGVHFPEGGIGYSPIGKFGSQYAAQAFSADSIILRVDLAERTNRVWVDLWNASASSNNDIEIKAYGAEGVLGVRLGDIGPSLTRVEYTHPTADIEYFTVDISGGFWSYPIDAVGAGIIPEPSAFALLSAGACVLTALRRRVSRT